MPELISQEPKLLSFLLGTFQVDSQSSLSKDSLKKIFEETREAVARIAAEIERRFMFDTDVGCRVLGPLYTPVKCNKLF